MITFFTLHLVISPFVLINILIRAALKNLQFQKIENSFLAGIYKIHVFPMYIKLRFHQHFSACFVVSVFKAISASAPLPPHLGQLEPVVFLKVFILEIIWRFPVMYDFLKYTYKSYLETSSPCPRDAKVAHPTPFLKMTWKVPTFQWWGFHTSVDTVYVLSVSMRAGNRDSVCVFVFKIH